MVSIVSNRPENQGGSKKTGRKTEIVRVSQESHAFLQYLLREHRLEIGHTADNFVRLLMAIYERCPDAAKVLARGDQKIDWLVDALVAKHIADMEEALGRHKRAARKKADGIKQPSSEIGESLVGNSPPASP